MIKPILVPTDKYDTKEHILYLNQDGSQLLHTHSSSKLVKAYDIILVDTEAEIVEGDWYLHHGFKESFSRQVEPEELKSVNASDQYKIITSTEGLEKVPKLSPQSIQLLINYYNEHKCMPESVEVAVIVMDISTLTDNITDYPNLEIKTFKLNQQGEVDITIPDADYAFKPLWKFHRVLSERLSMASTPQTKAAYTILMAMFKSLMPKGKLYTEKEVKLLLVKALNHEGYRTEFGRNKDNDNWINKNTK